MFVHIGAAAIGRVFFAFVITAAIATPRPAHAAEIAADPAHTSASFSVKHLTLTTVSGTIAVKDATIATAADGTLTSAKADLDLTTIDTKVSDRDADLKSDHWFDTAQYPTMRFASTKITGDKSAMTVAGTLTFHGKTAPVTLAAKYGGSTTMNGKTHVGYTATGTIDRTVWGVGTSYPPAIVGDDVTITIEFEAVTK